MVTGSSAVAGDSVMAGSSAVAKAGPGCSRWSAAMVGDASPTSDLTIAAAVVSWTFSSSGASGACASSWTCGSAAASGALRSSGAGGGSSVVRGSGTCVNVWGGSAAGVVRLARDVTVGVRTRTSSSASRVARPDSVSSTASSGLSAVSADLPPVAGPMVMVGVGAAVGVRGSAGVGGSASEVVGGCGVTGSLAGGRRGDGFGGVAARDVRCQAERLAQRFGEVAAGLVPVRRALGHRLGQDLVGGGRQIRPPLRQRRGRGVQVRRHDRHRAIPLERPGPGQQPVRDAGKRVLISAPVNGGPSICSGAM